MSTSDIDSRRRAMGKTGFVYSLVTLLCVAFGAIYESFSHEVYSNFMLYAFLFPFVGGMLPFFALSCFSCPVPGRFAGNMYHSGIAALTVGSFFAGALEIYGTTNRLLLVYWIVGAALTAGGILTFLAEIGLGQRRKRSDL